MKQIFDAIFGNIFFLIAIIAGLFSFFKNRNKEQEQKQQKQQQRAPRQTTPVKRDPFTGEKPVYEAKRASKPMSVPTVSIEEIRSERLEAFASQLQENAAEKINQSQTEINRSSIMRDKKKVYQSTESSLRQKVSKSLTPDGLITSIITAEILGKPRGLKPYRSIIDERKRR